VFLLKKQKIWPLGLGPRDRWRKPKTA